MSVLENARRHYQEALSGELLSVEVPEWNTTIYFRPIASLSQEEKALKLHAEGKLTEALVETLIVKALDEEGKKLFKPADRIALMKEVDPAVIIRVVTEINEAIGAAKEAGKN